MCVRVYDRTEHNLTISGGRTAPSTGPTSAPVVVSLDQDLDTEQHVQAVVTQRTDGGSSAWDVELTQDDGCTLGVGRGVVWRAAAVHLVVHLCVTRCLAALLVLRTCLLQPRPRSLSTPSTGG